MQCFLHPVRKPSCSKLYLIISQQLSPRRVLQGRKRGRMGYPEGQVVLWLCFIVYFLASYSFDSVQFSRSVVSDSLWPHGLQHARPPCPSSTPRVYSDSRPLSQWCHMPSNHLILLSSSPFAFNLSQHHSLFQWVSSSHQAAEVLEFQLQHHSFQWIFRTDFL